LPHCEVTNTLFSPLISAATKVYRQPVLVW